MLCTGEEIKPDPASSQNSEDQKMWSQSEFSSLQKFHERRMAEKKCSGMFRNFGTVGGRVHAEGEDDVGGQGEVEEDQNHDDV